MIETQLRDYLVYRVDERDRHEEIAAESDLECEAIRFADLVIETEPEGLDGIRYEVRITATGEPIHTTGSRRRGPAVVAVV